MNEHENDHDNDPIASRLTIAFEAAVSSARLQAALAAGIHPEPEQVEVLVVQCGVEPDFYVRDMLTWALTRHERASTIDRLPVELTSEIPQARSQSLHTLSKIGDPRVWPAISLDLLQDENDEVARSAWRAAVALVPEDGKEQLAELSLRRAFVFLGPAGLPVLERAKTDRDVGRRTHAIATEHLINNPDDGLDVAIAEAHRVLALLGAPMLPE